MLLNKTRDAEESLDTFIGPLLRF